MHQNDYNYETALIKILNGSYVYWYLCYEEDESVIDGSTGTVNWALSYDAHANLRQLAPSFSKLKSGVGRSQAYQIIFVRDTSQSS